MAKKKRILDVGEILPGGFRLLRPLGRGSFALVWLAEQLDTGQIFALKVAKSSRLRALLKRQAKTPEHPNIGAIHSYHEGADGEPSFLVMEYVEGANLRLVLDKHYQTHGTGLPLAVAVRFFEQIVCAVAFAHDSGICHGDLKPANVLVTHDQVLKVIDFGIIRNFQEASLQHSLSTVAHAPFTPSYLAPEFRKIGAGAVTPAADVYSLGILWHELITGSKPHGVDPPSALVPDLPAGCDELFRMCFTRVEQRISTAGLLALEIELLIDGIACREPDGLSDSDVQPFLPVSMLRGEAPLTAEDWSPWDRAAGERQVADSPAEYVRQESLSGTANTLTFQLTQGQATLGGLGLCIALCLTSTFGYVGVASVLHEWTVSPLFERALWCEYGPEQWARSWLEDHTVTATIAFFCLAYLFEYLGVFEDFDSGGGSREEGPLADFLRAVILPPMLLVFGIGLLVAAVSMSIVLAFCVGFLLTLVVSWGWGGVLVFGPSVAVHHLRRL